MRFISYDLGINILWSWGLGITGCSQRSFRDGYAKWPLTISQNKCRFDIFFWIFPVYTHASQCFSRTPTEGIKALVRINTPGTQVLFKQNKSFEFGSCEHFFVVVKFRVENRFLYVCSRPYLQRYQGINSIWHLFHVVWFDNIKRLTEGLCNV